MKKTLSEKLFGIFNYTFLSVLSLAMLAPFVHIASKSLSLDAYVMAKEVLFWPKGFNLEAYDYILSNHFFVKSFMNSVFITVVGTVTGTVLSVMAAYTVSKRNVPYTKIIMLAFIITMFFSGGLIPGFLLIKQLGLYNKLVTIIILMLVNPFYLIILRTFILSSIPDSLEESAVIDGADTFRIVFSIIIPLAKPVMAVIALYYAVGYWNDFFTSLVFLSDQKKQPVQLFLRSIIIDSKGIDWEESLSKTATETVRASALLVALIPIMAIYPFLQKYFVKGLLIGAVKG